MFLFPFTISYERFISLHHEKEYPKAEPHYANKAETKPTETTRDVYLEHLNLADWQNLRFYSFDLHANDAAFEGLIAVDDYGATVIPGLLTSGRHTFELCAEGVVPNVVVVVADADFEVVKTLVEVVDTIEDDDAIDVRFVELLEREWKKFVRMSDSIIIWSLR